MRRVISCQYNQLYRAVKKRPAGRACYNSRTVVMSLTSNEQRVAKKVPWPVRLLIALFWAYSLIGWLRVGEALSGWRWLEALAPAPGPLYVALTGALAGMLGLGTGLALLLRLRWSPAAARGAALLAAAAYWLDRVLFTRLPGGDRGTLFAAVLTAAGLALVFGILAWWQRIPARKVAHELERSGN